MKKLLFLFLSISIASQAQTIRVVNNNPGAQAGINVYFTMQAAIDDADPGDILHVIPSSVVHNGPSNIITVDKELTIIGVGFRADKDLGAKSETNRIDINASDVRIAGLVSDDTWYLGWTLNAPTTISNLVFENNRVGRLRQRNGGALINNMLVRNNIITASGGTFDAKNFELYTASNVVITNNVIITTCCSNSGTSATGITMSHNIFVYDGTNGNSGNTFGSCTNCLLEYNIFYGSWQNVPAGSSGNTFNYNMAFGNSDNAFSSIGIDGNTGTGNISDQDPLFDNLPLEGLWNDSKMVTIDAASPAINIDGIGGIAGVTGGATPWDPEGTLIPTIQSVQVPSVISEGTDMQIKVKAKGN